MKALVEGTEPPTDINKYITSTSTIPAGSDPLPGESNEAYVARQKRLQEEARERMRQKFGGSDGLRATGKMTGIGSDPQYDPQSKGIHDISEQLSAVTLNAYSFLSTSISSIGEHVKTASHSNGESNNQVAHVWSSLTKNATGLFQQAVEMSTDIVQIITTPEEEAAKFPRGNPNFKESSADQNSAIGKRSEDYGKEVFEEPIPKSSGKAKKDDDAYSSPNRSEKSSRMSSRVSSRDDLRSVSSQIPNSTSNGSLYRQGETNTSPDTNLNNTGKVSPTIPSSTSSSKLNAKKLPVEENDDFFGSFGLK